jgi:hypothetical protein
LKPLAKLAIVAGALATTLVAVAADVGHFPAQVTAPPLNYTGSGFVPTPTPVPPQGHFPPAVQAHALTYTGTGFVPTPTPAPPLGHFPPSVQAPSLNYTGGK